jgi:hypothetical protein
MPQNWEPKDWAEEHAHRVAQEVRRLRGKRSTQWLSDRTAEVGHRVSRSVLADLENGRRRHITTAEVMVLAYALNTAPLALLYPAPYWDKIHVFPTPTFEMPKIWAAQWFSGEVGAGPDVPFDEDGRYIQTSIVDEMNRRANLLALSRARKAVALDDLKHQKAAELRRKRHYKSTGEIAVSDEEIVELVADIADLQSRIDELRELGSRDLDAETYERLVGESGEQGGR